MKGTILEKILDARRVRVAALKRNTDFNALTERALSVRGHKQSHRLRRALSDASQINIIAEFKRASPSKGVINDSVDAETVARSYKTGGAAAISVLTEEDFFKGSLDDLRAVRSTVDLPILRKDFIFDPFQMYEAAEAGADAILLIAAMLDDDELLVELHDLADELGLDALVEVHTLHELERVKNIGAKLIGVNNRDLRTFNVSLDISRELIKHSPKAAIMITESGLKNLGDIIELQELGFSGFLIGETLMRSGDPETELRKLATEATDTESI
jgi:indole-3-glycerol phosphate synthase